MKRHEELRSNTKKQKENTLPTTSTPIQEFSLKNAIVQLTGSQLKKNELEIVYQTIKRSSESEGLPPMVIEKIIEAVGLEKFSVKLRAKLIDCLVPKSSVPEHAVIVATCYLTSMKFSITLKVKLLQWMASIYKIIDSTETFLNLYEMLFFLLESECMRSPLCSLLFLITKKEHVLIHRMKYLIDLQSRVGPQPSIAILIEIYINFRPDILIIHCKNKNIYRKFEGVPLEIQKINQPQQPERHMEISNSSSSVGLMFTKEVRTYKHLQESLACLQDSRGIQKLLQSKLRRILITSNHEKSVLLRLSLFIRDTLYVEYLHPPKNLIHSPGNKLLPILSEVAFELQEGITEVSSFIKRYIHLWDGETNSELVFDAIPYFKLCPYEVLYEELLQPLFPHFVASSISYKCRVIKCLSALYQNWILFEIERSNKANRQLLNLDNNSISDPCKEIYALACHLDRLCVLALNLHPDHPPILLYEVLETWEMITLAHSKSQCGRLPLPSRTIICAAAFSSNTNILDQMCELILRYKKEIDKLKQNATMSFMDLDILNDYILHTCKMLKNFKFDSLPNISFFSCELTSQIQELVVEPLASFNIYNHPSLLLCFKKFMVVIGKELLSVDLDSVADDYLNHLSLAGFGMIADFLNTFITEDNED